jgi:hypothetical protein
MTAKLRVINSWPYAYRKIISHEPISKIGFWFKIAAGTSFSRIIGFRVDFIILRGVASVAGFPV